MSVAARRLGRALACTVLAVGAVSVEITALWVAIAVLTLVFDDRIDPHAQADRWLYEGVFVGVLVSLMRATAWASWAAGRLFARAPLATAALAMFLTGALLVAFRDQISLANDCAVGIEFPTQIEGGCD